MWLEGGCNEATRFLKGELAQKAVQNIVRILKPWELEQVQWTAAGDVIQASEARCNASLGGESGG